MVFWVFRPLQAVEALEHLALLLEQQSQEQLAVQDPMIPLPQ
jgi:hypothetical protein